MTTIGYATLQIIPSLKGVTDAIENQVDGKVVSVTIEPKVDAKAAEDAGKKTKEGVEKHTREVTVEPKVDQRAADEAGKRTRESVEKHTKDVVVAPKVDEQAAQEAGRKTAEEVAKGASGSASVVGQAITEALQGAGEELGRQLGEELADTIPTGMTGVAQRIGTALRNSLPQMGASAGVALGTAIGIAVTDAIGKERLDKAGRAIMSGLKRAVEAANAGTDIGVAIGNTIAGGLSTAGTSIGNAAMTLTDTIGGIGTAIDTTKQLLGGDESWAAPGLDSLNSALGTVTPLLNGLNTAATLASAGAQAISVATGIASKAQWLWNAALVANPIGLIVTAVAALVAGLVLFFTKTELGRKIWAAFTEYLKIAWEAIKTAFSAAWDVISGIWDNMVKGAKLVWDGVKNQFTSIVDFVKGLPVMITAAAKGMWEGLKGGLVSVLNWIGDKWNSFADAMSLDLPGTALDVTIPKLPKFSFSDGGYTGNVAADQIAGVVHGGEHVIKASSRERIENAYPGLLDFLNNNGRLPGLPGYAEGGRVDEAKKFASGMDSAKYLMGGFSETAIDCSGFVSAVVNVATGRPAFSSRMSTVTEGSWLQSLGFKPGRGGSGDLRVGWWDKGGGANGHTAGTLPDGTNFESNSSDGVVIGGKTGAGDGQFTHHAYLPMDDSGSGSDGSAPDMLATLGLGTGGSSAAPEAASSSSAAPGGGGGSSSLSIPGSLSSWGSWAGQKVGDQIGSSVKDSLGGEVPKGLETAVGGLGDLGSAAGSLIDGQVSSALSVFGVGGSPGWLKGISTFVGGMNFGGGQGAGSQVAPRAAVSPAAAAPQAAAAALGGAHGGGQQPGPGITYNIRTATVEDAYLQAERRERERVAAKLARY